MTEKINLSHGTLQQKEQMITVEIPIAFTNIQEVEQLKELAKPDPHFLSCEKQEIKDGQIRLYYRVPSGYKPLFSWQHADIEMKRRAMQNLLEIHHIQGTQFTTYLDPNNIYSDEQGNVKFVYRGIRSVLPPEQKDGKGFVFQIKCLILSFFTGHPFNELIHKKFTNIPIEHPYVEELGKAKSLAEIRTVLAQDLQVPLQQGNENVDRLKETRKPVMSIDKSSNQVTENSRPDHKEKKKKNLLLRSVLLVGFLLVGIVLGGFITYVYQVKPQATVLATNTSDIAVLQSQLDELKGEKEDQEKILSAYKLIVEGKRNEAIELLTEMDPLPEEEVKVLARLYVELGTPDELKKAAELDSELHPIIAEKLVLLHTEEANEILLLIESSSPHVQIEQAWLMEEYERVISFYEDELTDITRAKTLAANSYYHLEEWSQAAALAEEINDIPLLIKIKNEQLALIENDDSLSEEEKEEEIERLEEEINRLKNE